MASFAVKYKFAGIVPFTTSVTGLKPKSNYDLYVDGVIRNDAARQIPASSVGSAVFASGSSPTHLKSDESGKLTFTFYPVVITGLSLTWAGNSKNKYNNPPPKKIELRGPDNKPVASTPTKTTPPANPTVYSNTKPAVPEDYQTTKIVSNSTVITGRTDLGILRQSTQYGTGNQTPLSEVSLYFDFIQSFYIDPNSVQGSQTVTISDIELFFKQKPHYKENQSQILNPGVYVYLCQMNNGQPDLTKVYLESIVRNEYDEVFPSLDATSSTIFTFRSPLTLKTGEYYGIVINFEDPQFSLWTAKQGSLDIKTGTICDGAYTSGQLYRASNYLEIDNDPTTLDQIYKPIPDTDLKFFVNVLEFDTNEKTIELVNEDYEFIAYNNLSANNDSYDTFLIGENIYQDFGNSAANVTFYKPGTLNVLKGEDGEIYNSESLQLNVTGTGTSFLSELGFGDVIVITDGTLGNTNIRRVSQVLNDTKLVLEAPTTFTNTVAKYKLTAVGRLENMLANPNTVILNHSTATDNTLFVKDAINYITFTAGSGYANTDYIEFTGGTVMGKANLTTNSIGHIASINITNTGYGFTTTPTVTVRTSTGAVRSGAATITAYPGSQLKGEISAVKAETSNVIALDINTFIPDLQIQIKGASVNDSKINFAIYNSVANTYGISDANYVSIRNDSIDIRTYNPTILSKSLEILNASTLIPSISEGKSSIISFNIASNNKYESPELQTELASVYSFSNLINNDATGENTNSGNAVSRHITKRITFAKDRFAEDIRLIANIWKPPGTDIKFYARIHNSKDEDAFDDKDWTELELKDATFDGRVQSSLADDKDYIELTYGFRAYPPLKLRVTGTAELANASIGNTTVLGSPSAVFNTQIANGDLILFSDPLFANTKYAVALVANTPTATSFEINKAISNSSLGFQKSLNIDVISNKHSAFNNIQNDNVVRYYSSSLTVFDTYDTLSIKIVPLSDSSYIVPRVNDIRVIGVSA